MTSPTAPPTGLATSRSCGLRSSSRPHVTRISTERSTARRSSCIRSRWADPLDRDRQPDEVIAAGLLHDTLEQTTATSTELQHRFGSRVARLVESVSDDSSISDYESRKSELRDRVARAETDTLAIFAADKISKVRELTQLPTPRLYEPRTRAKLTHYQATLEMLRAVAGNIALVDRLEAELSQLIDPAATAAIATSANRKHRKHRHPTA